MSTATIRERLYDYIRIADDKKLKAIYVLIEDDIKDTLVEYSAEFKADLDKRVNNYLKGGEMVTPNEMNKRLQRIRKKRA